MGAIGWFRVMYRKVRAIRIRKKHVFLAKFPHNDWILFESDVSGRVLAAHPAMLGVRVSNA